MKRFTDLNEISKDNSLVHFAIFRYEIKNEIDPQSDFDQRRRKKTELKNELTNMFKDAIDELRQELKSSVNHQQVNHQQVNHAAIKEIMNSMFS